MKVLRDMFAAILIGIMGGLLVTTMAYYKEHKSGGLLQTLFAVSNSFERVAQAYAGADSNELPGVTDYHLEDEVLAAFRQVEEGEANSLSGALLKSLLSDEDLGEGDILALDGENVDFEDGAYAGILRFHVRANSDTEEDQELKMAVKEDVLAMLKPLIADCRDVSETKNVVVSNLNNIYKTAVNTITEQGYDYKVKVYVAKEEFPAKTYGDLTFPEGEYQALRVDIGKAQGQNWWCVMFPPLCFVDESTAVVSMESKEKLKEALTPEEYMELFAYSKDGYTPDGLPIEIEGESLIYNWIRERLGR